MEGEPTTSTDIGDNEEVEAINTVEEWLRLGR
jgi:hypothetical protein